MDETVGVVRELAEAMVRMHFRVSNEKFTLLAIPKSGLKLACDLMSSNGKHPGQIIVEQDCVTVLATESEAVKLLKEFPNAKVQTNMRMITFTVPMDWEVVGFLSRVCNTLSRAGIPIGAVCGFYRDHIIIAEKHLSRARAVLDAEIPEQK